MSALKRSFLAISGLIAAAAVMQANTPAQAQIALFDAHQFGVANPSTRQSVGDADDFIAKSGGAFEPIRALRPDDEIRKIARSVGRVDVLAKNESGADVSWSCTGTLLQHGYVLTNHHCIPGEGHVTPVRAIIWMNYLEQDGREAHRFELSVTPVETDEKLDFAIVKVQGDASEFEGLRLSSAAVQPDQSLLVLHHPQRRPMVMTRFRCQAYSEQPDAASLRHRCDTLPGSSGALILSNSLQGVALHFLGGMQPGDDHSFNTSTRVTALAGASATIRALLASRDGSAGSGAEAAAAKSPPPGKTTTNPTDLILQEAPR